MAKAQRPTNFLERVLFDAARKHDFLNRYEKVRSALFENVLNDVTSLGNVQSGVYLTDHGPRHIETVIEKAGELVQGSTAKLTEYECFLLLVAILIHDLGNALGRKEHESKIDEVWQTVFGPLGFDEFDKVYAVQIASVHGGVIDGSGDTIRSLARETEWKKERIRPRLLAAFLRLADEMSEDRSRASQLGLALEAIPPESEVYHAFANSLHTFSADPPACELRMGFAANQKNFTQQFGKGGQTTYLLDEIFARSVKAFNEARYCSRYLGGALMFDKVRVRIQIYGSRSEPRMEIAYLLEETAFLNLGVADIYSLAPELMDFRGSGQRLDASALIQAIEARN